jgi:hypothetical protein
MAIAEEEVTTEQPELSRRGDLQKCPVCGSQVDADAYHCPHCHNYYCFHCRARLLGSDKQFQCINKSCNYYGKLVCGVCDPEVEKDEPPAVYLEPEDGYWPLLLFISFTIAVLIGIATWSFLAAMVILFGGFAGCAYALERAGVNVFGRENKVTQPRTTSHYTCICCHQPVREIRALR